MAKYATTEKMIKCKHCEREFAVRHCIERSRTQHPYDPTELNEIYGTAEVITLLDCPSCNYTVGWK